MEEERYARVQKSNGIGVFIKWEVVNSKTADKAVTKKRHDFYSYGVWMWRMARVKDYKNLKLPQARST